MTLRPLLVLLLVTPAAADGFRIGAHIAGGGVVPDASLAGGGGLRLGVQRGRAGFLVELGGFGGFSQDGGDAAGKRVTAIFLGSITPTVEIDLDRRAFASAGLVLGAGTWAHSAHSVDAAGTTHSASGGVVGDPFLRFLAGADLRLGWRLGERRRWALSFGIQMLFAPGHVATATVSEDGAMRSASDVHQLAFAIWPSISIGWDSK